MAQLLAQHEFELVTTPTVDEERRVRDQLRSQIARLERQLGELWVTAFPRRGIDWSVGAAGGPRVLGAADLERVRDALVVRVREAQAEISRRADVEESNRLLVEEMIADPDRYHWVRVSNEDVGERECKHWHARPRWGILGMLLGWWRVKVSSGCPLAGGGCPSDEQETKEAATSPTSADGRADACAGSGQASSRARRCR
jgi:hypothetical protein